MGDDELKESRERVGMLKREAEAESLKLSSILDGRKTPHPPHSSPHDGHATRILETQHAVLKAELEEQRRYMDEATEKTQSLEAENRRIGDVVGKLGPEVDRANVEATRMTTERD